MFTALKVANSNAKKNLMKMASLNKGTLYSGVLEAAAVSAPMVLELDLVWGENRI